MQLGICDIFEPNRADFRPMTDEKGIYVKHIEQSINVHIRTNPINQLRRKYLILQNLHFFYNKIFASQRLLNQPSKSFKGIIELYRQTL